MNQTSGWQGNLNLVYNCQQNTTNLKHSFSQAPLKIQSPFYPEGKTVCHSVVLHTAGGMVGGDLLNQNIHLEEKAQVLITTAAASKIYRSQGKIARQTIKIKVEQEAYLEWFPQETIVFNGAQYYQDLRVELALGASWLGWEITRFGRSARGEQFLQGDWRSHTEVWQAGKPLWIDRQWLPAGEEIIKSPHGLAGKPIVASLVYLGKPVSQEVINQVRNLWQTNQYSGEAGVTKTQGEGLLCRYRGSSTTEVKTWFMQVWELLRLSLFQRPIVKPRVW